MPDAILTRVYDIDMVPGGRPLIIRASQYDDHFKLVFSPYARIGVLNLTSSGSGSTAITCAIRERKPDKNIYSEYGTWDSANKTAIFVGNKQMTAIAGQCICELTLYRDDKELSTANFILQVEPAAADIDSVPSDSVVRELYEIADQVDDLIGAAHAIVSTIDPSLTLPQAAAESKTVGEKFRELESRLVTVDDTLQVQGDAADAKETGSRIAELNKLCDDSLAYVKSSDSGEYRRYGLEDWEAGSVSNAGKEINSAIVCRSPLELVAPNTVITYTGATKDRDNIPLSFREAVFFSARPATDATVVAAHSGTDVRHNFGSNSSVTVPDGARYVRFMVGYTSGGTQPVTTLTPSAAKGYFSATSGVSRNSTYASRGALSSDITGLAQVSDNGTYGVSAISAYGEDAQQDFPSDYPTTGTGMLRVERVSSTTVLQTLTHLTSGRIWQRYVTSGTSTADAWSYNSLQLGGRLSTSTTPHVNDNENEPYTIDGFTAINRYYSIQAAVANNIAGMTPEAEFNADAVLFVLNGGTSSTSVIHYIIATNGMFMRRLMGSSQKAWEANWTRISSLVKIDPTLKVAGSVADAKAVGDRFDTAEGRVGALEDAVDAITEEVQVARFTDADYTDSEHVKIERISDTQIIIYCTEGYEVSGNVRHWRLFNGEGTATFQDSKGTSIFPSGRYVFSWTEGVDGISLYYAPAGIKNESATQITNGVPFTVSTPFTVNIKTGSNTNFGTAESPTVLTVNGAVIQGVDAGARQDLDGIREDALFARFTDAPATPSAGIAVVRLSDTAVNIYGTATNPRRWRLFNGDHAATFDATTGTGVFQAGTYTFTWSPISIPLYYVPKDVRNDAGSVRIQNGKPFTVQTPFTVNIITSTGTNYGTEELPTCLTVYGTQNSAVDKVMRSKVDELENRVRDVPKSRGMLNAYKRALQLTNITYLTTEALPVPGSEMREFPVATFTDDAAPTDDNITIVRSSEKQVEIYGTAGSNRWWRLFNGEHAATTSDKLGTNVFKAGTYKFSWETNNDVSITLSYTLAGHRNDEAGTTITNGEKFTLKESFTVNVMTAQDVNYGTSAAPTVLTVNGVVYKKVAIMENIPKDTMCSGIPYGRSDRKNNMLGLNVSVLSFLTAVHNPYSAIYTEVVSDDEYSKSAYGIDYVSHHLGNSYPAMGTVCSGFTSYVLGLPQNFESSKVPYLEYIGVLKKAADQSFAGVQPLDILKREGHVAMVIDVYRDKRGVPVEIITAESAIKFTKITHYTPEVFESKLRGVLKEGEPYTIYRRTDNYEPLGTSDFYRETPFIKMPNETLQNYSFPIYNKSTDKITTVDQSPYVPAEVDGNGKPTGELAYNEDICTFMGDHPTFRDDELIVINFNKGLYKNLVITRDGEAVRTVTLPTREKCHAIVLTTDNTKDGKYGNDPAVNIGNADNYYVYLAGNNGRHTAGVYTAYLTRSGAQSKATTWQVRTLPISISETGDITETIKVDENTTIQKPWHGNVTVTFDSADATKKAVGIEVCLYSGMQRFAINLTDAESRRGTKTFDLSKTAVGEGTEITSAMTGGLYVNVQYKFIDTAGFPLVRASELALLENTYQTTYGYNKYTRTEIIDGVAHTTTVDGLYDPYRLANLMGENVDDEDEDAPEEDTPSEDGN